MRRSRDEPERLDALYVGYDGVLTPFGHSPIEPCLIGLTTAGLRVAAISFESSSDLSEPERRLTAARRLQSHGILWKPIQRYRWPGVLATGLDVIAGAIALLGLARRHRSAVVHARCYLSGLMALPAKILLGSRFVLDLQGFWPEERVELGLFRSRSLVYRLSKRVERLLLERADEVIVRTEGAKTLLREREAQERLRTERVVEKRISVVPCCADTDVFQPRPPDRAFAERYGLVESLVIGSIGSANRRYLLPETFRFVFHLKTHRPEIRFVHLARGDSPEIVEAARAAGLRDEDVLVVKAEPFDIPGWLSLFRLGLFFLRPSYAAKAASSSRLAQFLASGIPVVGNAGVGDLEAILGSQRCGLLLRGLTERDLSAFARQALPFLEGDRVPDDTLRNCRATALARFSLDEAVRRYFGIYESLGAPARAESRIEAEVG